MVRDETYLVLGGGGMIGKQVVRQISKYLAPRRVIVASLFEAEVQEAILELEEEFPEVEYIPFWGDVFTRTKWNRDDNRLARHQLLDDAASRAALYDDLFGDIYKAYERSQLVQLILDYQPDVVVDGINTATAISYQDVYTSSAQVTQHFSALRRDIEQGADPSQTRADMEATQRALDLLLLSQSVPQLIRHIFFVQRALTDVGARLYLKIGTTGTGGMGLNIPYTHSEDRPSATLMTKNAVAFAHTGLMFLMARTQGGPVVKELKPGAMVGYADIATTAIRDRGGHGGYDRVVHRHETHQQPLSGTLVRRQAEAGYARQGELQLVVADTGENGVFARGEFEAITHLRQMEFMTPEDIARQVRLEIGGWNTGYDVIAAIDSSVMNPTYRAGTLRHVALEELAQLESQMKTPSVAIGQLGPPELGKLLWEAHLLSLICDTLEAVLVPTAEQLAAQLMDLVDDDAELRMTITATGLPILTPAGDALIRGPFIRIPEAPGVNEFEVTRAGIEQWAAKGWVDLRPQNMAEWQSRFRTICHEQQRRRGRGSASLTRETYLESHIAPGAVVAWIFNNERGADGQYKYGFRIK